MSPSYRLYFLDAGGRIRAATDIEARSDGEAIRIALTLRDGSGMELWERARVVRTFRASDEDADEASA